MSEANIDRDDDDLVICLECGGAVGSGGPPPEDLSVCKCNQMVAGSAKAFACPSCGGSLKHGARACPYCHSLVATKRCGACLAWNLASAKHCQECGSAIDVAASTDRKSTEKSGLSCPRCSGALLARRYADLRTSECDSCGGMLLDVAMMNKVVAARDHSTALRLALPKRESKRETEVHYLTCPVCKKSMNRKAFGRISGVVVDVCKADGVWFDAGELGDVLAFVERGGLEEARKRELDDLRESKRALNAAAIQQAALESGHATHSSDIGAHTRLGDGADLGREVLAALASLWS